MGAIDTVLFDIGRVLVRLAWDGDKFGALMRAIGIPPDRAYAEYWSAPEVLAHTTGKLSSDAFYRAVVGRFGIDYDFERFREAWCDIFRPMPGMAELFGEVADRRRVSLLSDTDPLHWEKLRELCPWFDRTEKPTLSFEVGQTKPHPAMFAAAAANCGRKPEYCLFIDDIADNVEGARRFGMHALRFTGPDALRDDLAGLKLL